MNKDKDKAIIPLVFFLLLLSACAVDSDTTEDKGADSKVVKSGSGENQTPVQEITLEMGTSYNEEHFDIMIKEPVESEFPHITMERVPFDTDTDVEEALSAGFVPDMIHGHQPQRIRMLSDYEMTTDLAELADKYSFDTSIFQPYLLDTFRTYNDGTLSAFPLNHSTNAIHYNKEIFDLFGVDYPIDGMTWDELIELARQVTGHRDGIDYHGLFVQAPDRMVLDVSFLNPDTDMPRFTEDPEFVKYLEIIEKIYSIPGNLPEELDFIFNPYDSFREDRNLAMWVSWYQATSLRTYDGLDWDLVSYPIPDKETKLQPESKGAWMGISPYTEHEEEAFRVLEFLMTDEMFQLRAETEEQMDPARSPLVHAAEVIELDPELYNGRNSGAYAYFPNASGPEGRSKYELEGQNLLLEMMREMVESGEDINTLLRKYQEIGAQRIGDLKSKNSDS